MLGFSLRGSAAFEEWILARREAFRQKARRAFAALASGREQQGENQKALQAASRLAELDPFDEQACRQVMHLLAAGGRQNEALAHYEHFRTFLSGELRQAPQAETSALYERLSREQREKPALTDRRHNLPASLAPLIGREAELVDLQARILDPTARLLTVLGPGGIGKSRLALEAARGLLDFFAQGVFLIQLSPLATQEGVLPAVAGALGLPPSPQKPPLAQVQDYLREKSLLLVLDGCEARLESVPLLLEILRAAPGVKFLATSRAG